MTRDEQRLRKLASHSMNLAVVSREGLIELLVELPIEVELQSGNPAIYQSSLSALLVDARRATGRNNDGVVTERDLRGSWLGLLGYLCLIDQLGQVFATSADPHPFVATLMERGGVTMADAEALYGLRNAMAHGYGLANPPEKARQRFLHRFALSTTGKVVTPAKRKWDGGHGASSVAGATTYVNVVAIADLIERIVRDLRDQIRNRNYPTLRTGMDGFKIRSSYLFSISATTPLTVSSPIVSGGPPPQ